MRGPRTVTSPRRTTTSSVKRARRSERSSDSRVASTRVGSCGSSCASGTDRRSTSRGLCTSTSSVSRRMTIRSPRRVSDPSRRTGSSLPSPVSTRVCALESKTPWAPSAVRSPRCTWTFPSTVNLSSFWPRSAGSSRPRRRAGLRCGCGAGCSSGANSTTARSPVTTIPPRERRTAPSSMVRRSRGSIRIVCAVKSTGPDGAAATASAATRAIIGAPPACASQGAAHGSWVAASQAGALRWSSVPAFRPPRQSR